MKLLKLFALCFAVAALISTGFYGCAKKQVKTEGGQVEPVSPPTVEEIKKGTPSEGEGAEGKRGVTEAPPGPKEQPEPAESLKAEKALKDIHFDFDQFDIRPDDAKVLQDNAAWMKANPGRVVTIEGHCDERGTVEYNLALGERRAEAARKYLVSLGIKADRLKTISYGKSMPLDPGHDEAAWEKNRRAHFVVN